MSPEPQVRQVLEGSEKRWPEGWVRARGHGEAMEGGVPGEFRAGCCYVVR